jgi:hypothetical protein
MRMSIVTRDESCRGRLQSHELGAQTASHGDAVANLLMHALPRHRDRHVTRIVTRGVHSTARQHQPRRRIQRSSQTDISKFPSPNMKLTDTLILLLVGVYSCVCCWLFRHRRWSRTSQPRLRSGCVHADRVYITPAACRL